MVEILENIFGSKSKLRLMRFFILNPDKLLTTVDLREKVGIDGRTILSELRMFLRIGLIKVVLKKKKKYYTFNEIFPFYSEFYNLFIKANTNPQFKELTGLNKIGKVKFVAVGGIFTNYPKARLDILIVCDDIDRAILTDYVASIEAEMGKEVRYMAITSAEFNYRLDMMDRFVLEFLSSPHNILLNKLPKLKSFIVSAIQ